MSEPYRQVLYRNYSENFGEASGRISLFDETEARLFFELYAQSYAHCALPANKEARIGDLGCGDGRWMHWMRSLGYTNLLGVDHSTEELGRVHGFATREGDAKEVLADHESHFDLLHLKDVIEHCTKQEVVDLLKACRIALKPGGELWISTFNAQAPFSSAVHYGDFTHETGLTPSSMAQVLRACGFHVRSVRGVEVFPPGWKGKLRKFAAAISQRVNTLSYLASAGHLQRRGDVETASFKPGILGVAQRPANTNINTHTPNL